MNLEAFKDGYMTKQAGSSQPLKPSTPEETAIQKQLALQANKAQVGVPNIGIPGTYYGGLPPDARKDVKEKWSESVKANPTQGWVTPPTSFNSWITNNTLYKLLTDPKYQTKITKPSIPQK